MERDYKKLDKTLTNFADTCISIKTEESIKVWWNSEIETAAKSRRQVLERGDKKGIPEKNEWNLSFT